MSSRRIINCFSVNKLYYDPTESDNASTVSDKTLFCVVPGRIIVTHSILIIRDVYLCHG